MQQHTIITAQRLLNLYRQEHVIEGGWAAVNTVFLQESEEEDVLTALAALPTGEKLIEHINNLRSGKTPMDSIDSNLLPYGGMMFGAETEASLSLEEINELKSVLDRFTPDPESLDAIEQLPFVQRYGSDWIDDIKTALTDNNELLAKWDIVSRTARAYNSWNIAQKLVSEQTTERNRALIQANMLDFEMYLPMFGNAGNEILTKLRAIIAAHK